ncbi:MAG: hypothetical protein LBK23_00135 [Oscillospiraceae bacterium]|nr:hypothetical protein [Oscillospiraceae bacterium]
MRTPAIITIPFLSFNLAMGFYLINIRKRKHFVLLCSFKVVVLIVTAILCISLWRIGIVVSVVLAELLSAALAIILLAKSRAKK